MEDTQKAHPQFNYISLRYFNVAGAIGDASTGEAHFPETHLLPNILDAVLGKKDKFAIFGSDYDTKDGTCVRDYIHMEDLCDAHLKAMEFL